MSSASAVRKEKSREWHEPIAGFFDAIHLRALRSMRQFAEDEITSMPQGPRQGLPFRCAFMPWSGLVLDEFDSGRWRRMFGRGATQSGKTLIFTVIPTLYHLFEVEESVIFGAPTQDLAYDIFCERVLPVIQETRYARLMPLRGAGSRGGKSKAVRFRNGAILRFMGSEGADSQRSSYSARVAVLTEIDHMRLRQTDRSEAAAPDQIEARTAAYDTSARIYGECTVTTEDGRINLETTKLGTDTRIHIRCVHCQHWVEPVREQLTGWRDVETIVAAHEQAAYICQSCQHPWSEPDRQQALLEPRLVHRGQTVDESGAVTGTLPLTYTLGLVWSGMHSPMRSLGTIAEEEWKAAQSPDESLAQKVCQFTWSLPWKINPMSIDLSYGFLASHVADYRFDPLCAASTGREPAPLPEGIKFRIGTVDVQKRNLYVALDGYDEELTCWTLFWGVVDVVPEASTVDPDETRVRQALDEALGLLVDVYRADSVWVDTGYRHEGAQRDVVKLWCAEQGPGVNAIVGRSQGQMENMIGERVKLDESVPDMIQCRLQPDTKTDLWFFDVDRLKDEAYFRLFRTAGSPGYHYFPADAANPERTDRSKGPGSVGWIFSHYMRAKRVITQDKRTGREIRIWDEHGRHDLWDLAGYSLGGAYVTRAECLASQGSTADAEAAGTAGIRTRY